MVISRRVVLHFPPSLVDQPIVVRLVKDYELEFNLLKASVMPDEEGFLVLDLTGEESSMPRPWTILPKPE